jgi:DNA mismatch repair protein MutL
MNLSPSPQSPSPSFVKEEAKEIKKESDAPLGKNGKVLGIAFEAYILYEYNESLFFIDKHAAHERILFEDMKKNISARSNSQMLMLPIEVSLSPQEMSVLSDYENEFKATGFDFSSDGSKTVKISAIPTALTANQAETFFVGVAGQLASGTGGFETARNELYEQALYQASCKAAIKAGRAYDPVHTNWICQRVLSNPAIRFCPHGRPIAFELSKNEIEHWFKRK